MSFIQGILIVSHSATATTGYGRVARRLAHAFLKAGHRVAVMGAGYTGGPHELPYPLIPWRNSSAEEINRCCGAGQPNVLLTIGDPWMFEQLPTRLERGRCTWVAYFPIDGYPLPEEWKRWLAAVDAPVGTARGQLLTLDISSWPGRLGRWPVHCGSNSRGRRTT